MRNGKPVRTILLAVACCAACSSSGVASWTSLTFDESPPGVTHGQIITTQFEATHGVTIRANNLNRTWDLAVIYDSEFAGTGADPDLERQASGKKRTNAWSKGNIRSLPLVDQVLGNVLIISENRESTSTPGFAPPSDDEGDRPAGSLFLDFDVAITAIGFDLIDIEGPSEFGTDAGYVAVFEHLGMEIGRVGFADFVTAGSPFFDSTVRFGDNSANRIAPISFNGQPFDHVEFSMGGSGGITNLVYSPAPEPSSWVLILLGSMGLRPFARRWQRPGRQPA